MVVDASHGVIVVGLLGIEIAIPRMTLVTGNGLSPHFTNKASLRDVLLALVAVEKEDEMVMEALLGLPFQFPSVPQQMVEQGVGIKCVAKLLSVITGRLVANVGTVELTVAQVYPNNH